MSGGLTAQEAKDALFSLKASKPPGEELTVYEIRSIIDQIDVSDGTGKTTVIYTGEYIDGLPAHEAAAYLAAQTNKLLTCCSE